MSGLDKWVGQQEHALSIKKKKEAPYTPSEWEEVHDIP